MSKFEDSFHEFPQDLQHLWRLSTNFYWVWNRKIRRVFEKVDAGAWDGVGHNPIALLKQLSRERIKELAEDKEFLSQLYKACEVQRIYLHEKEKDWFEQTYGILHRNYLVAYFSAEFGITSCLRTYSGGLGILSGDHLKSASDLGIPLVGIGLFYKRGYFSQSLTNDGWQTETFPENDPDQLSIEPVPEKDSQEPLVLSVHIKDRQVRVRAWRASIGRVQLYLLDTNIPGLNSKEDCEITAELYGGDISTRIEQEMILGIGGAKLLTRLGIKPTTYHMNEGHSAFVSLERIRELVEDSNAKFSDARETVRASNLFTTHTPVPAGIDIFQKELFLEYLGYYAHRLGVSKEHLFSLGQETPSSTGFNMAVFAIRMSADVNAVSRLHKDVARRIWEGVLQEQNGDVRSISSVTNGIHIPSWISQNMADLYDEYLGLGWMEVEDPDIWKKISQVPNELLWALRVSERRKLIEYVRDNFSPDSILDPNALTIGFARRFATYKRANLILNDLSRLERILCNSSRPVQFIFAGKAHPKDFEGKKIIQEIFNYAETSEGARGKIVFLDDYDISVAQKMVQGVDLWLNNPRRPLEACGTSGMKVLANGGLNFSVLDGWWDEAFSASTGWAIGDGSETHDNLRQDRADGEALYDVLESQVIPEFFERDSSSVPVRWVDKIKRSIATLAPRFSTRRMVSEYSQRFYFKDDVSFASKLNRSELGVELLEKVATDWEMKINREHV
ncbi:MAG: alpha-glucan family phosphorylase [Nitrososphaerales archaeon]